MVMSTAAVPAGNFSEWLRGAEASLTTGKGVTTTVPCGSCTACCRSSMFVHIAPQETQTIRRIPRQLLFPAPGQPKGHVLLGYNDKGRCPMLEEGNKCSIYRHRPRTCRSYDCRVFAATGVPVDERLQPEIAERVKAWKFDHDSEQSREEHRTLQAAAAFLRDHRDLFPPGTIPSHPAPLAAFAVRIFRQFASAAAATNVAPAGIVQAIMTSLAASRDAQR